MKRFALLALTASLVMVVSRAVASAPGLTPSGIETGIRHYGAKATIATLFKTDQWDQVVDHIGSGDARWIGLASKLAPGSDAGSAEELGISLAFSLPKSPRAVLAALDPTNGPVIGAERVCGMAFIEDTVKDRPAYKRHALRALATVDDPTLAHARAACTQALRRAS